MKPYLALLGARYRLLLQYRAAALAGIATQLFFGLVRVMIFEGMYAGVTAPQPLALPDVITYIWLGQAFFTMMPWSIDSEIGLLVHSGNVAYEILRPVDLYASWYARNIASRVAPATLRALPLLVLAFAFLGMRPPASPAGLAAFVAAMAVAVLLSGAIAVLINISLLWTVGSGVHRLFGGFVLFACGLIIPIPLMPGWAADVFGLLPFSAIADKPFRLYTGQLPPAAIGGVLAHAGMWTVVLVAAGRALLARGLRRVVVAGG